MMSCAWDFSIHQVSNVNEIAQNYTILIKSIFSVLDLSLNGFRSFNKIGLEVINVGIYKEPVDLITFENTSKKIPI